MVCYAFTVRDSHPLLLAGLAAHHWITSSARDDIDCEVVSLRDATTAQLRENHSDDQVLDFDFHRIANEAHFVRPGVF